MNTVMGLVSAKREVVVLGYVMAAATATSSARRE